MPLISLYKRNITKIVIKILNDNNARIIKYLKVKLYYNRLKCMYCPTQLYDGRDMYRIYCIKNNYMFRHFILAIFRLRKEKT